MWFFLLMVWKIQTLRSSLHLFTSFILHAHNQIFLYIYEQFKPLIWKALQLLLITIFYAHLANFSNLEREFSCSILNTQYSTQFKYILMSIHLLYALTNIINCQVLVFLHELFYNCYYNKIVQTTLPNICPCNLKSYNFIAFLYIVTMLCYSLNLSLMVNFYRVTR